MTDESMNRFRRDEIGEEESVEEDTLSGEYHGSEKDGGLFDGHEGAVE